MPDDRRFSDEELEKGLRDLGSRMQYPPTPDVADAVRRRLEEEAASREPRRTLRWPPFLAPRWTAVAAALVVICVLALSPTLRSTLSGPMAPDSQAGSEADSAAKPEGGASQARHEQKAAGVPNADGGEAATACPPPSIEAIPARTEAGAKFHLRGQDFSPECDGNTPSTDIQILFQQNGKTWKLTTLDAGPTTAFETTLRVPTGADPGPARVQAVLRSGERAEERFVVP